MSVPTLYVDLETRGPDLKLLGLDVYARSPISRILLFPYAIDDGPAKLWDCYHQPTPPADLVVALQDPQRRLVAHHAVFDRTMLKHKANFEPPLDRWYCTEARANIHGLPGGLGILSKIFGLGEDAKKEERGKELINLFCKVPFADPDVRVIEWLEFCEYALYDVIAMRELDRRMPEFCFTAHEQRVYHLDQKINDFGFQVDLDLAEQMIDASETAKDSLNARVEALTRGAIQKATQRDKVKDFLNKDVTVSPGIVSVSAGQLHVLDMRAETLSKALRDHRSGRLSLTFEQHEMIELRLLTAKSSIAKCNTALRMAGPDERIRYATKYAGGGRIGRMSHKGFQPGNMPRPDPDRKKSIPSSMAALQGGFLDTIWGDEAMAACSDMIRGIIIPKPGYQLIASDWSNIEGRKLAWYAGEEWKLQMYRDADAGIGEDGYKLLGEKMTGTPASEIDDFMRQQFKGCDLSMGYEGGVGAFLDIANSYKLDLVELARTAPEQVAPEFMAKGLTGWKRARKSGDTHGLPEEIFVACDALKHAYRDANPNIKLLWKALLECAKAAVNNPGTLFACAGNRVQMKASPDWLAVQIPSGRKIMFAKPRIRAQEIKDEYGEVVGVREVLSALKAPAWRRQALYGGLIANAITQGGCRDILTYAMLRVDAAGYLIIMTIHDEIIAEVLIGGLLTVEGLIELMCIREPWFEGMPLVATGFTADRYRKD